MNYLEKENLILSKLEETDYALFGNNKDDALRCVTDHLLTIVNHHSESAKARIEASFQNNDRSESDKASLQSAINSIKSINNICQMLGIEPFMNIDTNDTFEVIKTINSFAAELYNRGINK